MSSEKRMYNWAETADVPTGAGVYAWYYHHMLTDYDISQLQSLLAGLSHSSQASEAAEAVSQFLRGHLFGPLAEEPYEATVRGPLKPDYKGKLFHASPISESLVARLVAEPARLFALQRILSETVPEFAAPIYIGMSMNLRDRIRTHKRLIETYKAAEPRSQPLAGAQTTTELNADHSFAWDVVRRGLSVNRLEVAVKKIESAEGVHVDVENILNRLFYPLCGRN